MKFFVLQRLLFLLMLLFFASVSVSAAYYDTSGTYEVAVPSLKVLDYPDSRASSIYELSKGDVIRTSPTSGQYEGDHAFLGGLLKPTSRWMATILPNGKVGFVWCSSNKFNKIDSVRAPISDDVIRSAKDKGKVKYAAQGKRQLKWIGIAMAVLVVMLIISNITDSALFGLLTGLLLIGLLVSLVLYLLNNPHSMWFVSPSIVGWGVTLLCIIPTFMVVMFLIGEFVGSLLGVIKNPMNIIGLLLLGAIVFLIFRAVYMEVADLFTVLIISLSGAGVRSSAEYGTLMDMTTGKVTTGVRFSGNKAYSGNRTFTNNGSGYYE